MLRMNLKPTEGLRRSGPRYPHLTDRAPWSPVLARFTGLSGVIVQVPPWSWWWTLRGAVFMDASPLLDAQRLDGGPPDAVAHRDLALADRADTLTSRDHALSSWSGWSWTHCMIARSASRSNAATLMVPFGRVHRWTAAISAS
jgi:hypothetical protein